MYFLLLFIVFVRMHVTRGLSARIQSFISRTKLYYYYLSCASIDNLNVIWMDAGENNSNKYDLVLIEDIGLGQKL